LPFVERNTEIFLHASLSNSTREKECVDTYLYRFAEEKSQKIGKVSRLLKENAVDCILNIEQTNFTVEKINSLVENQNIQLHITSQGGKAIDYQIGDKPYSSICDYMEICTYNCVSQGKKPASSSIVQKPSRLTYNLSILYRIRDLFAEKVFYTQREILQYLKEFELSEVLFLLTVLIQNKYPILIDAKGRKGYLVNKRNVYAFQPMEITDENISIYERSTPFEPYLPYFTLNELQASTSGASHSSSAKPTIESQYRNYSTLMEEIHRVYRQVQEQDLQPYRKIKCHQRSFYVNVLLMKEKMKQDFFIPYSCIHKYTILHFLDTLSINEKLAMLPIIDQQQVGDYDVVVFNTVRQYFLRMNLSSSAKNKYVFLEGTIFKRTDAPTNNNEWEAVKMTEIQEREGGNIYDEIRKNIEGRYYKSSSLNKVVGYFHSQVFKLLDLKIRIVNYGFNIAQANTDKLKKILSEYIDMYNSMINQPEPITYEPLKETDVNESLKKMELCVILEFFVRYLQDLRDRKSCSRNEPPLAVKKTTQPFLHCFVENVSEAYLDFIKEGIRNHNE